MESHRGSKPRSLSQMENNEYDRNGNKIQTVNILLTEPKVTSLHDYLQKRQAMVLQQLASSSDHLPSEDVFNRSIEIFFGNLTNFGSLCGSLGKGCKIPTNSKEELDTLDIRQIPQVGDGYSVPEAELESSDDEFESEDQFALMQPNSTVNPSEVRKLCLVGHPLTSFKGLRCFKKLYEAWITNCSIKELRWKDFKGLQNLKRLYLFGSQIATIEPLYFTNLRVLWLSTNKLTSLSFLRVGMASLVELNLANNQITCLEADDLFQCVSLQILNVAANPLCSVQDVEFVNVIPTLREFYLIDPIYGKCPVASLCESRSILIHKLMYIKNLDGKEVTEDERINNQKYIRQRCLYYFANCSTYETYVSQRKIALQTGYKELEDLGARILRLITWSAKCLQADYQLTTLPMLATTKQRLIAEVAKIHTRLSSLKQRSRKVMRRIETILRISRWEQMMEEWMGWLEYKSFGIIQSYIAYSVLDADASKDKEHFRKTVNHLFSGLSCSKPWPRHTSLKIETIIVIKEKASEAAMEKIFEDNYLRKNEPAFVPPPSEELEPAIEPSQFSSYPFYGPPSCRPYKVVPTYVHPDYRPPAPVFPYPESIPGLPERSQPLLLFLVTQLSEGNQDSLHYFHNLMFEKSHYFKEIRLTNCIWMASQLNSKGASGASSNPLDPSHSVLYVVKVLEECLVPMGQPKNAPKRHSDNCLIFGLRKPLCFTPAYIVYVSHIPNDKGSVWNEGIMDDSDLTDEVGKVLDGLHRAIINCGTTPRLNMPYYLHRTHEGVKADLTAITKVTTTSKSPESKNLFTKLRGGIDVLNVAKFLGSDIAQSITSLDLSGNRLGLTVGLEGLTNLQKLNLSHNNLTTLSGLQTLPKLRELRTGWNFLRFFHSNINALVWACKEITVLEVLPNPFQDIRDFAHIPVLAQHSLPCLTRVDAWTAPFNPSLSNPISFSQQLSNIGANFTKEVLTKTLVAHNIICMDYKGKCLENLGSFPQFPHFRDGGTNANGVIVDMSDNYLTTAGLTQSPLVQNPEWRSCIVQLQLQGNALTNLEWIGKNLFLNLRVLNLSNNQLTDIATLELACPKLMHLQISANPIPCDLSILNPLRSQKQLETLDASKTPLSSHPEYAPFVQKHLQSVQILNGTRMTEWITGKALYKQPGRNSDSGVIGNPYRHMIGTKHWNHLTEPSIAQSNLPKLGPKIS